MIGGLALATRGVALIGVAIAVANLVPIAALYWGPSGVDTDIDMRVASYNLRQSAVEDRAEVVAWLQETDADIVFLHEVSSRWMQFFDRSEVPFAIHGPVLGSGQPFGTMALVRGDAVTVETIDLFFRPAIAVTMDVATEPVSFVGWHALSPYTGERAEVRDDDFITMAEWVVDQPNEVVLTGDFNATPFSWSFRRLLEISGLQNSQSGFGFHATWPTSNILLRIPIDHPSSHRRPRGRRSTRRALLRVRPFPDRSGPRSNRLTAAR